MTRSRWLGLVVVALTLAGCERGLDVDWSAPENVFAVDRTDKNEDGSTRLEFHSLMDVPGEKVYELLGKPEDWARFVDGVKESGKISTQGNTKTTYITQKVIGRQNRAKVKWTYFPDQRKIEFETLESDFNYNDGSYHVTPSPDGKRAYVVSVFNLRLKGARQPPPGVTANATREAFKNAALSLKREAGGG